MQTVGWSQDMLLGFPAIDDAHEELLKELTDLLTATDERFGPGFLALIERFERDFREEEMLMDDIDYPGIQGHREQHARVLGALHHVAPRVMDGDIALGREAVELLPQWFLFHLSTMDTALAFALDMERQESIPPALRLAQERHRHEESRGRTS